MTYSPLAVHCTSLCFDVIQSNNFRALQHADIDAFHDDIYNLIMERSQLNPNKSANEHVFINDVTDGILMVLHECLNHSNSQNSGWIMNTLESKINWSLRTTLQ